MRRCYHCKKLLADFEFGVDPRCKKCLREKYKKEHQEERQIMKSLKINGCAICGYNKYDGVLDFHHVNPEDKKFSLNIVNLSRKKESVINELQKCILLCKNCHYELHTKLGGWKS